MYKRQVNTFDDGVPVTVNSPLNPVLAVPFTFAELLTFLSLTLSLTLNLCGVSVVTVTTLLVLVIPAITLGLRLLITLVIVVSSPTVLDSCNT